MVIRANNVIINNKVRDIEHVLEEDNQVSKNKRYVKIESGELVRKINIKSDYLKDIFYV